MIEQSGVASAMPSQSEPWTPRSADQLLADQLRAIDIWNRTRAVNEHLVRTRAESRDQKLEAARRLDALAREQRALVARASEQLESGHLWLKETGPRIVVAHRQEWFRDRIVDQLQAAGAVVLANVDDGADAAAAVVCDQPDLLILEELLPTVTGLEVLSRVRDLAPMTAVGVQTAGAASMDQLIGAGAALVFSRRIPPADVVQEMLACLRQKETSRRLV